MDKGEAFGLLFSNSLKGKYKVKVLRTYVIYGFILSIHYFIWR